MQLGFVGTGTMGNPMAQCLMAAGHQLTVYDLRREATTNLCELGARWAETPRTVAEASEVVFTSLPGPAEVEQGVLDPVTGILAGLRPGECLYRHDDQRAERLPQASRGLPGAGRRGAGCAGQRPSSRHDHYGRW